MRRCRGGVLVFGKTVADGTTVRRCRGGVLFLDEAVAAGTPRGDAAAASWSWTKRWRRNAVRRCRGGVLIVKWTNESAGRRVGGKALSKVGA